MRRESGHRVVVGEGDWMITRRGIGWVGGLVTDTWVVSEGGCASAASGDLRSGALHTILSYLILPGTDGTCINFIKTGANELICELNVDFF